LKNYGFPIDTVAKQIATHFPNTSITPIDNDSHTEYEAKKALAHVQESNSAEIVIATHAILAYGIVFDITILVSLESFLAAPVYSADESAFRMYLYAKELTKEHIAIQTVLPADDRMRAMVHSGEIAAFLKSESALRTTLKLPPEVLHVSLSIRGKRADVIESVRDMLASLASFRPRAFKELIRVSPTLVEHTTIIRTPATPWPEPQLCAALRTIDPVFDIKVQTD
jgi:primosomal protein N'